MKKITLRAGLLMAFGFFSMVSHAQNHPKKIKTAVKAAKMEPCGSALHQEANSESTAQFEGWIAKKITAIKAAKSAQSAADANAVVTIPVVIHVVHNGDAEGVNENISEAQALSQLVILNQDYRRAAGTRGFNDNTVGADLEIQFCLAKRTPDGQNTTGIVRHNIEHTGGWSMGDANDILKPTTQWDPEQYLNIWVVDNIYYEVFGYQVELAGFSTFPSQSGLEGLEEQSDADQDGVVIGHRYFGSKEIFAEGEYDESQMRDLGRSASHEIGHFLGLRHIWGDGGCDVDDYCEDTPVAGQANQECTAGTDTCPDSPGLDMIENYMDYTPDACMNIFTQDQKARMMAVLQNSPRRANLLTSTACTPASVFDKDGSLNVTALNLVACSNSFAPEVKITNSGSTTLTAATLSYNVDGNNAGTYNWTGSLAPDESATVTLSQMSAGSGTHIFNVALLTVNGSADQQAENDTKATGFKINHNVTTQNVTVNIQLDGYGSETVWGIVDSNLNAVTTGGPYDDADSDLGDLITETVTLESGQCYTFVIYDIAGDGICCDYGNGYYNLTDGNGDVFIEGGAFTTYEMSNFGVNMVLSTPQPAAAMGGVTLYPNPANSIINIAAPQSGSMPEAYAIYNSLGQMVGQGKVKSYNQEVSISGYANGVYFIKISGGNSTSTLQFVKY